MYSGDNAAYVVMPPETDATNASHTFSFDTKGFEAANILVGMNTHATNKAALTACKITEGDTTTAYSAIVAFTGGTATSSSVGFVIPNAVKMGGGGVMEFQVDLKARKRYLKVTLTPGDATANETYAIARLSRAHESRDASASGSAATDKHVTNLEGTNNTAVAVVVKG
jgi:hypothetical protein